MLSPMIRGAAVAVAALISGAILAGEQPANPLSEMTYEIRLIERPVGFERDRITGDAAGQRLESRLDIVDRGTPMKVESTFTVGSDLTPRAVEVTGKTYRFVNVDLSVLVENGRASIRTAAGTSSAAVTEPFFVARGYAPLAARAWLVRYWETHGRPRLLRVNSRRRQRRYPRGVSR